MADLQKGASMAEKLNQKEKAEYEETTIAEWIKYIRGSPKKVEFCRKLGIFRNTLQQWETNKAFPGFKSLLTFHKIFKVNINWLISGEGKPYLTRLKNPQDIETRNIKMESRITALEKKAKK